MKTLKYLTASAVATAFTTLNAQSPPQNVIGKEYTSTPDRNAAGALAPGQILLWDGLGGVVNGPVVPIPIGADVNSIEVDAQAHLTDAYFQEVLNNTTALAISVFGDNPAGLARIWTESPAGVTGVWAIAPQVDLNHSGPNPFPPGDVNSLELWGPEGASDTTHVSLLTDPASGPLAPIKYSIYTAAGVGVVTTREIADAIGVPALEQIIDLDGLFIQDTNGNGILDGAVPSQQPGDTIIFSIAATAGLPFDGGEIWTYVLGTGSGAAKFLNHGGHLWDTAFDVMATFGVPSEDVDAIEAVDVPEPGTVAAGLGVGVLVLARWYRSRRRS